MVTRLRSPLVWGPVSLVLLAIVVWRSHLWDAGSTIRDPDAGPLLAATALSAALPVLWAIRSASLLAASDLAVSVGALIPITTFANTINNLTPGSVGELLRLYLLRASHGVGYVAGAAVIMVERVCALGYLVVSALIVWLSIRWQWSPALTIGPLAVLAISPAVIYRLGLRPLSLVLARPVGRIAGGRWARLGDGLARAEDQMAMLLGDPVGLAVFTLTSGLIFATSAFQVSLVAAAVGVDVSPLAAWGALGLSIMVGVLSLLPFGLGAADLTLVALLGVIGVAPAQAGAIALGYRLVGTLPVALGGVVAYAWLSARLPADGVTGAVAAVGAGLAEDGAAGDDRSR
jgi:uncharacterized protein (TIRG00374 family)